MKKKERKKERKKESEKKNQRDWVFSYFNVYMFHLKSLNFKFLQYDGSNGNLDWRIYFRYSNFICIIKYLRSRLVKDCFIEWIHLHLLNFNLWLDLIKNSFFKVLTYFIRLGEKFYIILKKKSAQLDHFYRFYSYL